MEMEVKLRLTDEQVDELKMLQDAMKKATDDGDVDDYYSLEKVFEFVMQLSSKQRINNAIENAAYHYDAYYDDYPYKYGVARTQKMLEIEKETGEYVNTAYPNPRIARD